KEIIRAVETIKIPCSPPAIEGSFRLRDDVLSLINLATFLDVEPGDTGKHDRLILIMEMNNFRCGSLTDTVEQIHRIRWENVEPPSDYLVASGTPVVAVARIGERVVQVLDFETITTAIFGLGSAEEAMLEKIVPMPPFKTLRVL